MRKEGCAFDLPIAVGLLVGAGVVPPERVEGWGFVGELGLDGSLRPVRGAVAIAAACRDAGVEGLVVPAENAAEAAVVEGLRVVGAARIQALLAHLDGGPALADERVDVPALLAAGSPSAPDLADVKGQGAAKRALEVAAAGGHHLLLIGPPGAGKTMLARRLPGILPAPGLDEALEITRVHSVAGRLPRGRPLVTGRPFRAPHHTVSDAGLAGGGAPPRPGEVSLAHHGVLFLDELPEFRRNVLEVLRQPLEDGEVSIVRSAGRYRYPSRFLLVAAMNPCPCGHWGDGTDACVCDPGRVARYRGRISGPLLDRIDLHVELPRVPVGDLQRAPSGEGSPAVRARVVAARRRQEVRFAGSPGVMCNAHMGPGELRRFARPSRPVARLLQRAVDRLGLSARAYHRVLKVARTLADLEGARAVESRHAAEAVQYRTLDRGVG